MGGEEEMQTGRGSPGSDDQGRSGGCFLHPLSPGKPVGFPGLVPYLPGPPLAMSLLRAWVGGQERPMGRGPLDWRIEGNVPSLSPTH